MAGARPEYFPVILALAASEVTARGSTSSSGSAMVVVNGPIRHEIGMNCGIGAMGPYNHANATIGRAYGLLSQNLQGGSVPGDTFMGSHGNAYTYNSITFAENEERSPWEPLHVQQRLQGRTTASSACSSAAARRRSASACAKDYWREHVRDMLLGGRRRNRAGAAARSDHGAAVHRPRRLRHQGEADPLGSRDGADAGRPLLGHAAGPELHLSVRDVRREPLATRLKAAPDELIPMFLEEDINVVVVGGETNGYWRIMGAKHRATVSIDDWR